MVGMIRSFGFRDSLREQSQIVEWVGRGSFCVVLSFGWEMDLCVVMFSGGVCGVQQEYGVGRGEGFGQKEQYVQRFRGVSRWEFSLVSYQWIRSLQGSWQSSGRVVFFLRQGYSIVSVLVEEFVQVRLSGYYVLCIIIFVLYF